MKTIWLQTTDSTNSEAHRVLADIDKLSVIAAYSQTAGRGQRGNRWTSAPGENLTFSIILKPVEHNMGAVNASDQFIITEIITLALAGYLKSKGIESKIKWPNDIYCGNRKICGILIENSVRDGLLNSSVIGVGLNLNQTVFPSDVPNPTSMKLETGESYAPEKELDILMEHFSGYVRMASSENGYDKLKMMYLERMYRRNELHNFIDCRTGSEFRGIIRGISTNGCLTVENEKSEPVQFAFKEISYII